MLFPYVNFHLSCVHLTSQCVLSHIQLFATPWTVVYQAPLSMVFSKQEYWSGLSSFLQGIFLTQGLNLGLLHCRQTLPSEPPGKPSKGW